MAPARIPEGMVFIPRHPEESIAKRLLDSVEEVGGDRALDVRTVSGGYHVTEAAAKEFVKTYGAELGFEENADADADAGGDGGSGETDEEKAAREAAEAEAAKAKADAPKKGWSHAEFDEWAGKQEPKIEFSKDATLPQKLEEANAAIAAKSAS